MTPICKSRMTVVALFLIVAWLLVPVAQAGEHTAKGRTVTRTTKAEVIEVGDVKGHVVGVYESKGLIFFEDGSVATLSQKGTFDYLKGTGPVRGYNLLNFDDGSTRFTKWEGKVTFDPATRTSSGKGTFEMIKGTGQFEGIKGKGTWRSKSYQGFLGYSNFEGTYTLPQ